MCNVCNIFLCNFNCSYSVSNFSNFNKNKDGGQSDVASSESRPSCSGGSTGVSAEANGGSQPAANADGILSFAYTNATSLNNKIPELTARLSSSSRPKVVIITETWFNEFSTPVISGYNLYHEDRKKTGGGVCIYVCVSVVSVKVCEDSLYSKEVEVVWCEIKCGLDRVLVGCFYKNPRASTSECHELCRLIRNAKSEIEKNKYTALVIAGDFNFPRVKWINGSGFINIESMKRIENVFIETLDDCALTQCITEPTFGRTAPSEIDTNLTEGNILDLLLTCSPERIFSIRHEAPLGDLKCAHDVLTWDFAVATASRATESRRRLNYNRADFEALSREFSQYDWASLLGKFDVNSCYEKFLIVYNNACAKYVSRTRAKRVRRDK